MEGLSVNIIESNVLLVCLATILAVVSPGPDFAIILRNGLRYRRKLGLVTALGIACGVVVHITYTLLGLSYIVAKYTWVLEFIRYAGAGYLIWLGVSAFLPQKNQKLEYESDSEETSISGWGAFRNGFFCNALNPKTMLFFIALFTQVISPSTSLAMKACIGFFISVTHLLWFSFVVLVLTNSRTEIFVERWRNTFERVIGMCLFGLGAKLALDA